MSIAKLKLMVESKKVELDVADIPRLHYLSAVKANYLEKIDYSIYNKTELSKIDDLSKQAYGVGAAYFSYVMAFDNEKFPPGRRLRHRSLRRGPPRRRRAHGQALSDGRRSRFQEPRQDPPLRHHLVEGRGGGTAALRRQGGND